MIDVDWVGKAALTLLGIVAGGLMTALLWLMKLGNRVTALETRMTIIEQSHVAAHKAALDGLKEIGQQTGAIVRDLSHAREEALHYFAERDDLKGLEVKLDNLQKAVTELSAATKISNRRRSTTSK